MTTVLEHAGGFEKYLIETAANLAERPGLTVDVFTLDNDFTDRITSMRSIFYMRRIDKKLNYKESLTDIQKRLGKARYHKVHNFRQLRRQLREYDVIYSKNELIEAFLFKFRIGYHRVPPVVFGGHTPLEYPHADSFHAKLHNFLYGSFIYRFLAGPVTKYHAINNHEANLYARLFGEHRVTKVYNPFDIPAFAARAKQYHSPHTFEPEKLHILWVGRLTEQKGIADLAQIIPEVNQQLGDKAGLIQWSIVGDGDLRSDVEQLAEQQNNVHYYGHVDQKYMASIYKQHQVLVSTSKWEGYPYTLIEPQAFGLEIFAYNIPGSNDILSAYAGGHLAEDMDSMIRLLSERLQQYTANQTIPKNQPSTQFKPEIIYKQLIQLLSLQS